MGGKNSTSEDKAKSHQCNHMELQNLLLKMEDILTPYNNIGSKKNPVDESVEVNTAVMLELSELVKHMKIQIISQNENKQPAKLHTGSSPKDSNDSDELQDPSLKTRNKNADKRRLKKCIQIISPVQTNTTNEVSPAIKRMCKDLKWKCKLRNDIAEISERLPLVVLCQISSRFEPDIDYALNGISWKMPFVVLLIHSTIKSALPVLPTALKLKQHEKYRHVEFIDIAFTESKLLHCQMNETARNKLNSFFETVLKK